MARKVALLITGIFIVLFYNCISVFSAIPGDIVDTEYEDAVTNLAKLGIISGSQDGNFHPQNNITRAEATKVVIGMLKLDGEVGPLKDVSKFKDVSAGLWANGYINVASEKGLFKGDSEGNFNPNNDITYAETVTILIRALGLGPETEKNGVWPSNYIEKAEELGLLKGVSIVSYNLSTSRGDFAIISWNTLNVVYDTDKSTLLQEKFSPADVVDNPAEKSLDEIAENIESSVSLRIFKYNSDYIAERSGVVIDNGLIVTTNDVINNSLRFGIIFDDTPLGKESRSSTQYYSDEKKNLVLIGSALAADHQSAQLGDSDKLKVGQKVVAIGGTTDVNKNILEGTILDIKKTENQDYIEISIPVSSQMNGGGLYNMQGELIGILSFKVDGGKNWNIAIPINDIKLVVSKGSEKYNVKLNKELFDEMSYLQYSDTDVMLFSNLSWYDENEKIYRVNYILWEQREGIDTFQELYKSKDFREFLAERLLNVHHYITESGYQKYGINFCIGDKLVYLVYSDGEIHLSSDNIDNSSGKELEQLLKSMIDDKVITE